MHFTNNRQPCQEIAHFLNLRFFLAAQSLALFDVTLMYDVVFYGFRELRNIPFLLAKREIISTLSTCRNMRVNRQAMELFNAFFMMDSKDNHTVGINTNHLTRRQVGNGNQSLADQFFRLISVVNTAQNGHYQTGSYLE